MFRDQHRFFQNYVSISTIFYKMQCFATNTLAKQNCLSLGFTGLSGFLKNDV